MIIQPIYPFNIICQFLIDICRILRAKVQLMIFKYKMYYTKFRRLL
jgi:hypothetical protein